MTANTWFSARLLFVSEIPGDPDRDRLCEESIIVLQATDEAHARQLAQQIGLSMQHAYDNNQGEQVQWLFHRLLELQDLCAEHVDSGTEVYSRLFRESQALNAEVADALREPALTD